jgi:hypothetical protein
VLWAAASAHGADRSLEHAVKATFLYKFASFVEWPPGSFQSEVSPFHLCIVGADPFGGATQTAARGQTVGRHPVVVRRLQRVAAQPQCHAVFISGSAVQDAEEVLQALAGEPVLTITDSALGTAPGVIHFVIADDRVTFDIDNVAAARQRLVISSKLLALARRVRTSP